MSVADPPGYRQSDQPAARYEEHHSKNLSSEFDCLRSCAQKPSVQVQLVTIAGNRCVYQLKRARPFRRTEAITAASLRNSLIKRAAPFPWRMKMAFALAKFEQLPCGEIATIKRTTLGTVKFEFTAANSGCAPLCNLALVEQSCLTRRLLMNSAGQWAATC